MSGVIVGAIVLVISTFVPGVIARVLGVARLRRLSRGKLLLTYDDGPSPVSPTPQILELLRRHRARATFFLVGARADEGEALCDRLVAEGHDVGAHGYEHRHGWRDPLRAVPDLVRGVKAVARWQKGRPIHRQPNGKSTLWTVLAASACGARTIWWTIDSQDSWRTLPDVEVIVARAEREEGGVVLMHDFAREAGSPGARFTLSLTDALLGLAARRGWPVCTVTELLGGGARTLVGEGTR